MGEIEGEGQTSIRQKGDGTIIKKKSGSLSGDFIDQGVQKNVNSLGKDSLSHVAGPQPAEQAGTYFRATTPRKQYSSTDADVKLA